MPTFVEKLAHGMERPGSCAVILVQKTCTWNGKARVMCCDSCSCRIPNFQPPHTCLQWNSLWHILIIGQHTNYMNDPQNTRTKYTYAFKSKNHSGGIWQLWSTPLILQNIWIKYSALSCACQHKTFRDNGYCDLPLSCNLFLYLHGEHNNRIP